MGMVRALAIVSRRAAADRASDDSGGDPGDPGDEGSRWRRPARVVLAATTVVGLATGLTACHPQRWQSQLVSVNAAGTDSANGESRLPVISRDGTKVVFVSDASDLGPTDTNGQDDVYVRDLTTGVTELVSVNAAGTDSGNNRSFGRVISPDGTKVAFSSDATDLTTPAPGPQAQVYVRDLVADTTTLVSVSADGTTGADGHGAELGAGFSPDSRRYLFESDAGNLVSPSTPGVGALYERDLPAGVTIRLAPGYNGTYSPSGDAVAFFRDRNLYLRDAATGTTTLLVGGPADTAVVDAPVFSPDGTKVAFAREPSTGVIRTDIYVYDRVARSTSLVTTGVSGGGSNGTPSIIHGFHPTDANRLLFSSAASNLVPNDTNRLQDLFVRNLSQRTTTRVVSHVGGVGSDNHPSLATWVGDGTRVAFVSLADDFGVTDTNGREDVYVLRLGDGTSELVSESGAGHDSGNGRSGVYQRDPQVPFAVHELSVSADGTRIAFGSYASNLGPTDSDRPSGGEHDVYVAALAPTGP